MTWFDYAVLAIVGVSVLLGVIHGLVRELLALASWMIAFLVAQLYAADAATLLTMQISHQELRLLAAFIAVFLIVYVAMKLLTSAVSRLVKSSGLGGVDRLLGSLFGLVRGGMIVMVMVLLAGLTALPKQTDWRQAMFSARLEALANVIKVWLPYDLSKQINYG